MKKKFRVKGDEISLETTIPAQALLELNVELKENDHGRGKIEVLILEEFHEMILNTSFGGDKVSIIGRNNKILFTGLIEKVEIQVVNKLIRAIIYCASNTILMDKKEKRRSFQNPQMTYTQVLNKVISEYDNAMFIRQEVSDCAIKYPLIQYDETDWEFLKRLATHFNTVLYPESQAPNMAFYLGCRRGRPQGKILERQANFSKSGISDNYYTEGGFEEKRSRSEATYIELTDRDEWDIGDTILCEKYEYVVYRKKIVFSKGEVTFSYLLGKNYFLCRKKRINKRLSGASIKGEIKKTECERVHLQLEIDEEENAYYSWNWTPETGNLCYCMPEVGSKVVVYFASGDEKDGIALHTLRMNSRSGIFSTILNREIHTQHDKKMALYPERLFIEGKDKATGIYLDDKSGIQFKSPKGLKFNAVQGFYINGKKEVFSAPMDIVCRTNQSNIEINRDINLYAPGGVQTNGGNDNGTLITVPASVEKKSDHWQIAYSALAAVPTVDFNKVDDDGVVDLMVEAAIPKIATGKTTLAMSDVMKGIPESKTRYPNALHAMELYTVKGGYPLPDRKE